MRTSSEPAGEPPAEHFDGSERHLAVLRAAITTAHRRRRELTVTQAAALIREGCRHHGVLIPGAMAQELARPAIDFFWPLKHPIKAHREGRTWSLR